MRKVFLFLLILLGTGYTYSQNRYQWPFPNPTQQSVVTGSVGEYRQTPGTTVRRFHQGVDLVDGGNYAVHAINSGSVAYNGKTGSQGVVTIISTDGTAIRYIHTDALPGIGTSITTVEIGTQIGTMGVQASRHLHLESDNINFLHRNLYPYIDRAIPYFSTTSIPNGVAFYRNGLLKTTTNTNNLLLNSTVNFVGTDHAILYDKVDIVAHVIDSRTNSDGSGGGGQLAATNSTWNIRNSSNTELFTDQLNFSGVPNNDAVLPSFHPLSDHGSPSIHILTSHPRTEPWDRFFNTRLRADKTENWAVPALRSADLDARYNGEAKYPDGKYTFEFIAFDVDYDHNPNNSTTPLKQVATIIDNFLPYVAQVEIRKNTGLGSLVYSGRWNWANGQLTLKKDPLYSLGPTDKIWIKITTSEPTQNVRINIPLADGTNYSNQPPPYVSPYSTEIVPNKNNTEFVFVRNPIASSNDHTLNIMAEDLAGNSLQSEPSQIPIRQADGTWSPGGSPGTDSKHQFKTGNGACGGGSFPGGRIDTEIVANTATASGCMFVDFTASKIAPVLNEPITFTPTVSGSGLITYEWNFGSGATPASSTASGAQTVVYSALGPKTISLKICDATTNCITEQKVGAVNVGTGATSQLVVDFSASQLGANTDQNIQLTSTVTGAVGNVSYSWHFDSGLARGYLTEANPLIAYVTPGNKTISLTVTDASGSVTKVKNSYLLINSILFNVNPSILGGCLSTGADGTTSFSAAVSGGNGPPYSNYRWDFGDGTTSTLASPTKKYTKSGKYTVRLTVCDATSCGTTERVNCVTVPDIVDARTLAPTFLVNNIAFGGSYSAVVVGLNTPVTFTDATVGGGNPATFSYNWDFESHIGLGGNTESAVPSNATTRGPHEVYFTVAGYKQATITVVNSGTSRTKPITNAIEVRNGLGSGRCYANIGTLTISSTCWSPTSIPQFTVPVAKTNCPIAKTEVIYWRNGIGSTGTVLPNNKLDFAAMNEPTPNFPFTGEFSFAVYQYDGVNYNRIGYKRQKFTIYGPVLADGGVDKHVCLGESKTLGTTSLSNLSYQWTSSTTNALAFLSSTTSPTPTFTATQKGTYTYGLVTTDKQTGCSSPVDNVVVVVNKPEVAAIAKSFRLNETATLAPAITGGFGGNTYNWAPASKLSSATIANPTFVSASEGNDNYLMTVTDQRGCKGTGEVFINVSDAAGDVKAIAASYLRILVTWLDRSDNEIGYLIQRSVGNNTSFTDYATVAANVTSFDDTNIQKEITYYYRVITLFGSGNKLSIEVFAKTGDLPLFSPMGSSSFLGVAKGDFDNDFDLDVYYNGKIYMNNNGVLTLSQQFELTFLASHYKHVSVADFDNDGDLDIYRRLENESAAMLLNNNGVFSALSWNGRPYKSVTFDYDNDNDVDIMNNNRTIQGISIFKNLNQTSFNEIQTGIERSFNGEEMFGIGHPSAVSDLDNDGDQDLVISTLLANTTSNYLGVFTNIGGSIDKANGVSISARGAVIGDIDIADFDNDGDKDFIFAAYGSGSHLFQNQGSLTFTKKAFPEVADYANAKFGDMDGDGDLDLLYSGNKSLYSNNTSFSNVYENVNNQFSLRFARPIGVLYNYFSEWHDVDNDGDLDIGTHFSGVCFLNNLGTNKYKTNSRPQPPSNLCAYINGQSLTMSWSRATDAETPSLGLSYNIYVKQNGNFIQSPLADIATGFRKIVKQGNVDQNTSWTITLPSTGGIIEWGVQAIDTQFIGSPFATSSAIPVAMPPLTQTICSGQKSNFTFPASGTPFSWVVKSVSNVTGATAGSGSLLDQTLTNNSTVVGTVVYIVSLNKAGCATYVFNATVNVNPAPGSVITASGPTTFCSGESVRLTAPAGTNYLWSTLSSSPFIDVTQSGTYNVTVTNQFGCNQKSSDVVVTVNFGPKIYVDPVGPIALCQGTSITLRAGPEFRVEPNTVTRINTFYWSTGQSGSSISVSSPGIYTVNGMAVGGGCSSTRSIVVNSFYSGGSIVTDGELCANGYVQLYAPPSESYLWSTGENTGSIWIYSGGSYTVTITNGGCSESFSIYIPYCPPPPPPFCDPCSPCYLAKISELRAAGARIIPCEIIASESLEQTFIEVSSLSVFPNPANKKVTVAVPTIALQDIPIKIVDQTGLRCGGDVIKKGFNFAILDIGYLNDGFYYVEVGKELERKKLVVINKE